MRNSSSQKTELAIGSAPLPSVPHTLTGTASLSIASLRLPQDFGSAAGVKKVLTTVPFRKPNGQVFFRVHPEWRLQAAILQLKDDGENYIVAPHLYAELSQEVRPKMVYTGITRDGTLFLWPVNLESEDGRLDSWSQSAHQAAKIAEKDWIRMVANRSTGGYDVFQAIGELGEPAWPEMSFDDIAQLAFRDRFIDSLSHPILKGLRGEQ